VSGRARQLLLARGDTLLFQARPAGASADDGAVELF
jgi:hypothetical protein